MIRASSLLVASACLAAPESSSCSPAAVSSSGSADANVAPTTAVAPQDRLKDRPITYVALGDSTGIGVGAATDRGYVDRLAVRLRERGARVDVVNLCRSGGTSDDILRGALDRAIVARPSVVTLGIGVNDLTHGIPVERFAANLERIASAFDVLHVPVVVVNLPDLSLSPAAARFPKDLVLAQVRAFNEAIDDTVRRHHFTAFDLFTGSQRVIRGDAQLFSGDGFHPSSAGYEAWTQMMWPTFEGALVSP